MPYLYNLNDFTSFLTLFENEYNKFKTENIIEFYKEFTGEWKEDKNTFIKYYYEVLKCK